MVIYIVLLKSTCDLSCDPIHSPWHPRAHVRHCFVNRSRARCSCASASGAWRADHGTFLSADPEVVSFHCNVCFEELRLTPAHFCLYECSVCVSLRCPILTTGVCLLVERECGNATVMSLPRTIHRLIGKIVEAANNVLTLVAGLLWYS